MSKIFFLIFLFSFQLQAAQFEQVQNSSTAAVNELQSAFNDFSAAFEKVSGHCTKNSQLSFTTTSNNQRLISVAKQSLNFINTGYDRPADVEMTYYGALSELNESFSVALKQLTGARQFNAALRYFRDQNDHDSALEMYAARELMQSALSKIAMKKRVLVYAGEAKQAFGAFQFVLFLDPNDLEISVFQSGWCE